MYVAENGCFCGRRPLYDGIKARYRAKVDDKLILVELGVDEPGVFSSAMHVNTNQRNDFKGVLPDFSPIVVITLW